MIGDLPLSQAGIPGQTRINRFVRVSSDIKPNEGIFVDDPAGDCFSVTCRHVGPEKGQWFSRSRFSRDSLEQVLSSFPTEGRARPSDRRTENSSIEPWLNVAATSVVGAGSGQSRGTVGLARLAVSRGEYVEPVSSA